VNEKKSQRNSNQNFLKNNNFPPPQPQMNINQGACPQNNDYEAMMNMFKMFGPQMMGYMSNVNSMGMNNNPMALGNNPMVMSNNPMGMGNNPMGMGNNPMDMGFNQMNQMNPMHPMNPMNPLNPMNMMKSVNQMNTMHINNLNNPTLITSTNNSQIIRDKNEAMGFSQPTKNFSGFEDNKMEEMLKNKARNLNDFYNSVNFVKKNEDNFELGSKIIPNNKISFQRNQNLRNEEHMPHKATSKKFDNFLDESEIKLPNKSEFLNYQEYDENSGDEMANMGQINFKEQSNNFKDSNNSQNNYNNNFKEQNNNFKEQNNKIKDQNRNTFKETDKIKQNIFQNEKDDLTAYEKFDNYNQDEEFENFEKMVNKEKNPIKENLITNNNYESKAKSSNQIRENEQIPSSRKNSDQNTNRKEEIAFEDNFNFNKKPENIGNSKPFSSFDDIPISNKGHRNFEEMLAEELQSNQYNNDVPRASPQPKMQKSNKKKKFLKRHSRQFLSSAAGAARADLKKSKIPINNEKNNKIEEEDNFIEEQQGEPDQMSAQKKAKKYLTKGRGIGGGKGPLASNPIGNNTIKDDKISAPPKEKINTNDLIEETEDLSNKKKYEPNRYVSSSRNSSQDSHHSSSKKIEFNDDKEWVSNKKNKIVKEKENKAFESKKLNFEEDEEKDESQQKIEVEEPEEQSNLIQKYFNKNKKKEKVIKVNVEVSKEQEEEIIKKYVDDKIEALNQEIAKFKSENESVKRLKKKYEEMNKTFTKQMEDFAKKKESEKNEFELLKQEEIKKIKMEKKVMERQNKSSAENKPTRKEREEIDTFKKQIAKLTEENKLKDQRNKLAFERLRKQNEDLIQKNQELQEEIKHLENLRLTSKNPIKDKVITKNAKNMKMNEEKKEENIAHFNYKKNSNEIKCKEESEVEEDHENEMEDYEKKSEKDEEENDFESYEDIINKNPKDKKIPLQETKSTNKKVNENVINANKKENYYKKTEEDKVLKENLKKSNINPINKKKEIIVNEDEEDNEENEEKMDNPYANITIRNLNKFFNEKDFDFDSNEYYLRYMKQKSKNIEII